MVTKRSRYVDMLQGLLFVGLALSFTVADAAGVKNRQLALVIGNGDYRVAPLVSPGSDASAMAAMLKQLDFDVIRLLDAGGAEMSVVLEEFAQSVRATGAVGLFYYAGHAVEIGGENYLLPVDADLDDPTRLRRQSLSLSTVLAALGEGQTNIVLLDACRDNPYGARTRSIGAGLAAPAPARASDTLIAYATSPGQLAVDGDDYGLFTKHALVHLGARGVSLDDALRRVRRGVIAESRGAQIPWQSSSLTRDVYLNPGATDWREGLADWVGQALTR